MRGTTLVRGMLTASPHRISSSKWKRAVAHQFGTARSQGRCGKGVPALFQSLMLFATGVGLAVEDSKTGLKREE